MRRMLWCYRIIAQTLCDEDDEDDDDLWKDTFLMSRGFGVRYNDQILIIAAFINFC